MGSGAQEGPEEGPGAPERAIGSADREEAQAGHGRTMSYSGAEAARDWGAWWGYGKSGGCTTVGKEGRDRAGRVPMLVRTLTCTDYCGRGGVRGCVACTRWSCWAKGYRLCAELRCTTAAAVPSRRWVQGFSGLDFPWGAFMRLLKC